MINNKPDKILALTLACRSARALVVRYLDLMTYIKFTKEEITARHVLHQIDDALKGDENVV